MQVSHSRIETFQTCPYKYFLSYSEGLDTLPRYDDPTNALTIGLALHKGVEEGVKEGIRSYYESFPVLDDLQVNEAIKLEYLIPKVRELVPEGAIFEHEINHPDFKGFIDMLVPVSEDGEFKTFDLYDFKYSNHTDRYLKSAQLHLYKYFYEKLNPYHTIRNLGFIFAPKTQIRQKKTEDLNQFRKRLVETLQGLEVKTVQVKYDPSKVIEFLLNTKKVLEATEFPKHECKLCGFCNFEMFCKQGEDYMLLPKNERRVVNRASRKKVWLYGAPFAGKTTFANQFPDPIFLNTDGNLNTFDAPYIEIKETLEGRQRVFAWANFKDALNELQKGSEFKTIVVDLVEDLYEHCRLYCYDKLGIEHESDNGFKAWDYIRTEFLSTMKKLMTLDYNIVLISHEDTSKDITKKSGDKITAIKPNIQEKTALKLAGMVDIVARVVADGDDRTLQFKSDDVVFGGGRLKLSAHAIPLTYEALEKLYENQEVKAPEAKPKAVQAVEVEKKEAEVAENGNEHPKDEQAPVETSKRQRKVREKAASETPTQVTWDEVEKHVNEAIEKHGKTTVFKLVREHFSIRKFSELDESKYPEVITLVQSM